MNPSIEEIFAAARSIKSQDERAAYLEQACGGDAEKRQRVEALLAADAQTDSLLDQPFIANKTVDHVTSIEQPGDSIGHYKLLQQIGEGGFGQVFMAEQREPIQRQVAVKIINPGMDSRQVIARFEAERQALALMDHPNIARVLDAGTTPSGRPYFVMELVHGIPITRFCDDNQLTPRQRLELFMPVCHAIQHAHQKGIIHRDINPSNVLVCLYDGDPVPKVIDFGVAKAIQQRLTEKTMFTQFGQVIGTFEYMSPEQAEMNQLDIDTRSDVYSLGTLLYELLTGTTPFEPKRLRSAAFDELLRIIREEEPPLPSIRLNTAEQLASISAQRHTDPVKLSRLVRGELDWIVMKALEKQRSRRYESASGLAKDIERHLEGDTVEASPPSAGYRVRKFVARHRNPLAVAATILLLLLATTAFSSVQWLRANRAAEGERISKEQAIKDRDAKDVALKRTVKAEVVAENRANEARRNLYIAHMRQVQLEWERNNAGTVRELLDRYAETAPGQIDLRGCEWDYWNHMCQLDLRTLQGHEGAVRTIAFSVDNAHVASGGDDGKICIWRVASGKLMRTIEAHSGPVHAITFHPDGDRLISGGEDRKIIVLNHKTGNPLQTILHSHPVATIGVAQSGKLLAAGALYGRSRVIWDVDSGERRHELQGKRGVSSISFIDGDQRLLCAGRQNVEYWDLTKGESQTHEAHTELLENNMQIKPMTGAILSPDEKTLVTFAADRKVKLWDAISHENVSRYVAHDDVITSGAFHPDGRTFATASEDRSIKIWDRETGEVVRVLRGHSDAIHDIAISSDGWRIASASGDGTVKIWDANQRTDIRYLLVRGGAHHLGVDFSNDGRKIAVGSINGRADGSGKFTTIVDATTHDHLRHFADHQSPVFATRIADVTDRMVTAAAQVHIWKLSSGEKIDSVDGGYIEVSPQGNLLVVSGSSHRVYDLEDPKLLYALPGAASKAAFDREGMVLALPMQNEVRIVEPETGHTIGTISTDTPTRSLHFSSDGRFVGGRIRPAGIVIWRVSDGSKFLQLPAGRTSLGFDKESKRAMTHDGNELQIIHLGTGDPICTIPFLHEGAGPVTLAPDGSVIAIGNRRSVSILDTRQATSALKNEHEAQLLVAHLLRYPLQDESSPLEMRKEAIVTAVREANSISEQVRHRALSLIDQIYTVEEQSDQFTNAAFKLLDKPDASNEELNAAYELAKTAYELYPDGFSSLTFARANYALDQFQRAEEFYEQGIAYLHRLDARMVPTWQCFLAMAQFQSGKKELAKISLANAKAPNGAYRLNPAASDQYAQRLANPWIAPDDLGEMSLRQGLEAAHVEDFATAQKSLAKAAPIVVGNMRIACLNKLAQVHLALRQYDQHRTMCRQLAEEFDIMQNRSAAFRLLTASAPLQSTFEDWSPLVEASVHHAFRPGIQAAVRYRSGDHRGVIELLENEQGHWEYAFLSMAYAQVGELESASNVLQKLQDLCASDRYSSWHNKVDTLQLLEEANSLIYPNVA